MAVPGTRLALLAACLCPAVAAAQQGPARLLGELRRWHKLSLEIDGPAASESGTPNPFLDYRLEVTFRHPTSQLSYRVPGYFAADGRAAETSARAGKVWRAHLSPDQVGTWTYTVHMRQGPDVALSPGSGAGTAVAGVDGLSGQFQIRESDKSGRDHRALRHGRLGYVGKHHLHFASGRPFLKVGADSPENLLAYADFDNTPDTGGRRKTWAPHLGDWRSGDPSWQQGRGKGLIGAVNYMARKGMNAMSFLTYSYNGDDGNVFVYADPRDRLRLDCSKLDQWEIVFSHMDRQGIFLHFKTQETENDQDLDGGALGRERKLYYRELIARFGHHLALNWNLGEENTNTDAQRKAFAQYIADLDSYDHHIVVHTYPNQQQQVYTPLLGNSSRLSGASLQIGSPANVFQETRTWLQASAAAGRPWVVCCDEQGHFSTGIAPDSVDPRHDGVRQQVLWGHLMAGGAGIEAYFGYQFAHSDLSCQDFRSRDTWWEQCRHAHDFFQAQHLPFADMQNADPLVSRGHCLAGQGAFVVYLPQGGSAQLDLSSQSASYTLNWFDPIRGGGLQTGSIQGLAGGAWRGLGNPPHPGNQDWVLLLRASSGQALVDSYGRGCPGSDGWTPRLRAGATPRIGGMDFGLEVHDGRPGSACLLLLGTQRADLPLPGACSLRVQGIFAELLGGTDVQGSARFDLPIPQLASLLGREVFANAGVLDPAGAFAQVAALTQGLRLELGR